MSAKSEQIINLRDAIRNAIPMLGAIHLEKCGGSLGWLRCKCNLADTIRNFAKLVDR